jgi:galactose-1-phosphate uridylyltransferase
MNQVEGKIERRRDPLTGRIASSSSFFKGKKEILFPPTDWDHLRKVAEKSRSQCFFCPERVEQVTPKYQEKWVPEGRLRVGDCLLFPNLFPVGAVHAVIVLGKVHFRTLEEFSPSLLRDGFEAASRFTRAVFQDDPTKIHFTLNCNYLHPAGASMIHPHLQLLGGAHPAAASEELHAACLRFRKEHGADYFKMLVEQEQVKKERYIGSTGPVLWLTPFAPTGTNEVLGILNGYTDLLALDDEALLGLTLGLSRVLTGYYKLGFSTFNFTLYSPPILGRENPHPLVLRIICRQNVYPDYRADDYFIQKLLGEELMLISPEELAEELKPLFAA